MEEVTLREGVKIKRWFQDVDRYHFDFGECSSKLGWKQWDTDQDASYYGVWVHPEKLQVMTYAEGDVSLLTCDDREKFREELKRMADFYGDPPPMAIGYDDSGVKTEYYDERYMGDEDAMHTQQ